MRTVLTTAVLALGLAVSGCTGDADVPDAAATPSSPSATQPTLGSPDPELPRTDGPLQLDDSSGKACASLSYGREYTAWEHILRPEEDVEITGFQLVGAEGVRAPGQGFVAELPGKVPATGFALGFPPAPDVVDARAIDWKSRRPAVGATLAAGTASNLWVRIQVDQKVRRAHYEGLELSYTSGGREFTTVSEIRTRFRWRCA